MILPVLNVNMFLIKIWLCGDKNEVNSEVFDLVSKEIEREEVVLPP